jgi:hypothetical protein
MTIFGLPSGGLPPAIQDIADEAVGGLRSQLRNRYRHELARSIRPARSGIIPFVSVSSRAFRGRRTPDLAALSPVVAAQFGLVPDQDDVLGYLGGDEKVVRSVEWQEAFDQGRRRHEPISAGSLLQIRRKFLSRVTQSARLDLWGHLVVKRTVDRYKPEREMEWHERSDVFPVRLQ